MELVTIIVPFLNEEDSLPKFLERINSVISSHGVDKYRFELIFVDDGSSDNSNLILRDYFSQVACSPRIQSTVLIQLTRNFGKEAALSAGLSATNGVAAIPIDCDLQDPPELIPKLIRIWEDGYDMAVPIRRNRSGERPIIAWLSSFFYRVFSTLSSVRLEDGAGDYRLLDRKVVDSINSLPESRRFMKGLYSWVGYKTHYFKYDRDVRQRGISRFPFKRLLSLAFDGIISFSSFPLYISFWLGSVISLFGLLFGCWVVLEALLYGNPIIGYPSLLSFIVLLGGLNLFFVGLVGVYISKLFYEVKRRPSYLIDSQTELLRHG